MAQALSYLSDKCAYQTARIVVLRRQLLDIFVRYDHGNLELRTRVDTEDPPSKLCLLNTMNILSPLYFRRHSGSWHT